MQKPSLIRTNKTLLMILASSIFIHLWNPVGFPDLFFDEGVYMRRAMHVLNGLGPQEAYFYDHPFFGQIFLAGMLSIVGYPDMFKEIEDLYLIPRVWMGILAVIDTFLIYKIADKKYNRRVALIAAALFAVMPITWLLRRILLDTLLLPLLLSSILFALYAKESRKMLFVSLSGIFLGLALFTKIPILVMIPLVAFLIYKNINLKLLALWFIPVIVIPLLWPLQSIINNQFDLWVKDVLWQTQRKSIGGFANIVETFILFDPLLFMLTISGLSYAIIKKELMILLFVIPFMGYLSIIGYTQYFHILPILPAFAILGAIFIDRIMNIRFGYLIPIGILIFGFVSTTMLITSDLTSAQFETMRFVLDYINDEAVLASPVYTWIFIYVYNYDIPLDYSEILFYPIDKEVILITDTHFIFDASKYKQLAYLYNNTIPIAEFEGDVTRYNNNIYPYTNMKVNYEGSFIEVRVKP
ncbi:MAG: hypothetical protein KatS3mg003_1115 [Candidatus Nitrosocaldaceae archaeon]|nr:MAG: hypothetical protein KatS3mg003_1115 [Candidatus Nitrosocaldaceae archaeon]